MVCKLSWVLSVVLALAESWRFSVAYETKPGCQPSCGNLIVPYPHGVGKGCSIANGFEIICNTSYNPPKPFLGNLEVVEISSTQIRVKNLVAYQCYKESGALTNESTTEINLIGTPYTISAAANKFTCTGCDTLGVMQWNDGPEYWCVSQCDNGTVNMYGGGSGQIPITKGINKFNITVLSLDNHMKVYAFNPCSYAFLVDQDRYTFQPNDLHDPNFLARIVDVPFVLDWAIKNQTCKEAKNDPFTFACQSNSECHDSDNGPGYRCICKKGYEGNPYLSPGCQDIDECRNETNDCQAKCKNTLGDYECFCDQGYNGDGRKDGQGCIPHFPIFKLALGLGFGLLCLLVAMSWLYLCVKKRKLMKLKEKFFEKNGGLLLRQKIDSHKGAMDSPKIYTVEELDKATNNFSEGQILGRGGSGTVYKGYMPNNRVVAIKKSKMLDDSQIELFINELVILTQINHRHVVKLLGCCLETEVPILVYEFISNNTLFHNIHHNSSFSWDSRIRIAIEAASALAYLHSTASISIIHRDVKSTNILLDDTYTAKVSDFGASRLIPVDQSQITTLVQGTLGYLDPEYLHIGKLTEKSDVYSFGVVLAELLTGEMPISFGRSEAQVNLSSYFVSSMEQNRLSQILEPQVASEGHREQVIAFAELTRRCLEMMGNNRPTMKEVVLELERLRRHDQ